MPTGWSLTNIVCTGDITGVLIGADGDFDAGDTSVSVPIDAGDDVNCVFTNTEHATLDIDKVTVGGNGTFDYEATGSGIVDVPAAPDFSITTVSNNGSFPDPGVLTFTAAQLDTKTVTETVPTGWSLTNIVCTGDITGVLIGADGDFDAGDTSVSVPIDAGDDVNCVFTNTEHATLDIDKVTVGGNGTFDYEATGSGIVDVPAAPDFSITTVSNNGSFPDPGVLTFTAAQLDTKTVTETVPTGWSLTNIVCTGDITGVLIGADGDFDAGDTSVSVPIDAGDDVNCVFTNTEHATLDIDKVTVGGNGTFDYEATGSGIVDVPAAPDFSITTVSNNGSFPDPGVLTFTAAQLDTKTVTETVPTGWSLTNIVCTGDITGVLIGADGDFDAGDTSVSVPIDAGDDVNCVFTNTEHATLDIDKVTVGGNGTFDYEATGSGIVDVPAAPDFSITTVSNNGSFPDPGVLTFTAAQLDTKTVTETVPTGWSLTNIVCTGDITGVLIGADGDFDAGDTSVSVPIDAGDDVNCVFTNTEHATLDIDKVTVGGNGTFDYEATGSGIVDVPAAPDFSITTVSNNGSFPDPGVLTFTAAQLDTKTVTETVPTGWSLTNIVCTGDITGVLIGADGDFDAPHEHRLHR